ncbi:MAG TPA: hypothetical protein VF286_11510, partial [Acidiphilium sp.]
VQSKPVPVTVKIDARDTKEDTTANGFINWMFLVKAATDKDKSLSYSYGPGRILKDGTVAVSVSVKRGDRFMSKVSFIFHFHPGVKGPAAGHGYASKWHFKPFDGARKYVRLEAHAFNKLDSTMVKTVKEIARKKRT